MSHLAEQQCEACDANAPRLRDAELEQARKDLPDWQLIAPEGIDQLCRVFTFKNFRQALAFANQVGELAEAHNHHPALLVEWGKVTVRWWTHKIGGLHRNDFVMAAKTDELVAEH